MPSSSKNPETLVPLELDELLDDDKLEPLELEEDVDELEDDVEELELEEELVDELSLGL